MRLRSLGAIAVVAALAVPAAAEAVDTSVRLKASQAASRALAAAADRQPACRIDPIAPFRATMSDEPPGPAFVEQLAILRRPQTEADVAAADRYARLPFGVAILRSGARAAQGPDGRQYDVVPLAGEPERPATCAALEDRLLRRDTRAAPLALRREARKTLRSIRRAAASAGPRVAVAVDQGGAYGGGGGVTAEQLAAGAAHPGMVGMVAGQPTLLYALVRDGAASVTWRFTTGDEATAPVQDNIAAVEVGFMRLGMQLERTILRDAAGAVIADVPAPGAR